jgi:hypothetical protein
VLPSWLFGAVCCCCRSLVATLILLSLGKLIPLSTAFADYLFSWCLGARSCCDYCSLAVLVMLSFGKPVLFVVAVVY